MNFYQAQDRARRRSRWLVWWFVLAVLAVLTAVEAVAYLLDAGWREPRPSVTEWLRGPVWPAVAAGVLIVIASGTLYTSFRLRDGGPALARMLGARRVDPATADRRERQLVNVVEEMSLASGTPVPALYVLDEEAGINAFVAGTTPASTVMVITRGALDAYTRDELQGVVAHEYSHVFNQDMLLNLRLMGLLAGVLLLAQLGRVLLRSARGSGRQGAQIALAGIALSLIGWVGLVCGNLIKAAISRQREYLADAQAVQFTRYPHGLAGALHRIREHAGGSRLANGHADDISHFCFAESVRGALAGLLATHPPLARRIRAIAPDFVPRRPSDRVAVDGPAVASATVAPPDGERAALAPAAVALAVAAPRAAHADHARHWQATLPASLAAALHDRELAAGVVLALVVRAADPGAREAALAAIANAYDAAAVASVRAWLEPLAALPRHSQLPMAKLALPALSLTGAEERRKLLVTLRTIVAADSRLTTFEFALLRVLAHGLGGPLRAPTVRHFDFAAVAPDIVLVLSVLARVGAADPAAAAASYARASAPFGLAQATPPDPADLRLERLERSLATLAELSPLLKRNVIEACADAVLHDGSIEPAEADLLESVALALGCPLPPLLVARG